MEGTELDYSGIISGIVVGLGRLALEAIKEKFKKRSISKRRKRRKKNLKIINSNDKY